MILTFLIAVRMCYGEYAHGHGAFTAMGETLMLYDFFDRCVVIASLALVVWYVPRLLLTAVVSVVLLFRPGRLAAEAGVVSRYQPEIVTAESRRRSELSGVFRGETNVGIAQGEIDNSWSVWLNVVRNEILERKLYLLVGAVVALLAGLAAHYNSTQFNPNIRPLVAVLRSNFWLVVHVTAIIVSYAAAGGAAGLSAVALGGAIFGKYRRETTADGKRRIRVPVLCETLAPIIYRQIQIAVFLLALGTILGARWADYSWGRFWSWDPKEVWALITLLFLVIVLHGRIGRLYGPFGVAVGGLLGMIAVMMTLYGINFVFKAGMHAYGGDTADGTTIFLVVFVVAILLWATAALGRYGAEVFGTEHDEPISEPAA
jgi:ABC-type transport system involved in cytochrome c biogenesis permease subunit